MPIKGLTDREERFPEIGQIRKGGKKDPTTGAMGRDLTYFRVEFDERETEAIATFNKLYGDKPTQLPVMLAFNEVNKVWDAWYEAYTAGRLVARSDGETYQYRVDTKTGEVLTGKDKVIPYVKDEVIGTWVTRSGKNAGKVNTIKCKPVGRLRVVLPDLGRLAYLTVITTSIHDIINLSSQITALAMFNSGRIAGIPLILRRSPREISCPNEDGTRARRAKWMLSIEADPEWVQKSLTVVKALSLPTGATTYLPEPVKNMAANQGTDLVIDDDQDEDDSDIPGPNDDAQEGEFSPIPTEGNSETSSQEKTPIDNNGHKRPYEPLITQRKMGDLIDYFEDKITNEGLLSKDSDTVVIVSHLEQIWAGLKDATANRHAVIKFLTGKESAKALTGAEKLAIKHWLGISKNPATGEWIHSKDAAQESIKIVAYLLQQQGQQSLPLEEVSFFPP